MIRPLESQRADIKEKIRTKEKVAVSRLHDLLRNLEQENSVMRRSIDDLDALFQSHSDIHFLKECPQDLFLKKYTGLPSRGPDPMQYLKNVTLALAKMRNKLKVFVKDEAPPVSRAVAEVDVLPSQQAEPKSRSDFLQYSCELSFDPKTKTKFLTLSEDDRKVMSEGNKKVKFVGTRAVRPKKNRAGKQSPLVWAVEQCLSKESLTGRQYWEVSWTTRYVSIAMGYKDSLWNDQGADDKSWALIVCPTAVEFKHNDVITLLPGPHPSRVGVYLDYRAGTLRFYCSDTMTLLHKVQTIFTQPLFAGVTLDAQSGATAEFCYPRLA
ncbi:tripartite motif-containing protein 16-like [Gadus chalcogrammus]|nr:tripartite motif-containing protein 16-like [Gadus chalcogrammus]